MRPDVTLQIDGNTYVMRPSHGAIDAIERRCGAGFNVLLQRLRANDIRFGDCAIILEETIKAGGGKMGYDAAFTVVQDHFGEVIVAVSSLIGGAFGPPPEGAAKNPPPAS